MRKYIVILFLLLPMLIMGQGRYPFQQPHIANSSPSTEDLADLHYDFEGDGDDISGNGLDAETSGMVYGTTNPIEGSQYGDFSTSTRLFKIPDSYVLSSPFSMSCHVRHTATGGYYRILDPHQDAGNWEYWLWWLDGVLFDIEFRGYQNITNTLDQAGTANSTWTAGSDWFQIGITYDDGDVEFFLDGVSVGTSTTWGTADMMLDGVSLYIGRYFAGDIDDFSLYSFILSSSQWLELATPGAVITE